MNKFIIRVRHNRGMTRFELKNKSSTTIRELKELIFNQLSNKPNISTQQLTLNGKSTDIAISNNSELSSLNIKHGDILYLKIIPSAIICESNTMNNTKITRNKRKRKFNEIDTSSSTTTTSMPSNKRLRLNSNNNNNNNHNQNTSNTSNSSFIVHTLSNIENSANRNTSNNSNNSNNNAINRRMRNAKNTNSVKEIIKKKPSKKKKNKKKKKKDEFLVIKSEGDSIDEIVDNYLSEINALKNALDILPKELQSIYSPDARIEAILDEKVEVIEYLEQSRFTSMAKSRGKRHLIVIYSFKRKKRKESVCFYDDEKIGEIISNLLWKSVDENEREEMFIKNKINHKNIMQLIKMNKLTFNEMAIRSPPLLWSLFHSFPNQKIEDVLEKFVKTSLKELRIKTRDFLQNNDNSMNNVLNE